MEKIIKAIEETKANSAQRAHEVEGFINEELNFHNLHFEDMQPTAIIELSDELKQTKDIETITDLVEETINVIEEIANDKGVKNSEHAH